MPSPSIVTSALLALAVLGLAPVTWRRWRARPRRVRLSPVRRSKAITLESFLQSSPLAACLTMAGRISFMNRAMEELSGFRSGCTLDELFRPGEDRERAAAAAGGVPCPAESRLRLCRPDGAMRHVGMTTLPAGDGGDDVYLHWLFDHTALQHAERAAADADVKHRSVIQSLADSMVIMDERGNILSFSPASEKMFGYRADEVVGRSVSILMPSPDRDHHDRYVRNYVKAGWATGAIERSLLTNDAQIIRPERETVAARRDGTTFPIRLVVSEVNTGDERFFVGLMSDLTDRKRLERELKVAKEKAERAHAIIEVQKRRMQDELDVGRQIQLSMVPNHFPALATADFWGSLRPAREVGGDFYDFFMPTEDELWLCIGDVSGKGVPAALFMAVTKTLIKSFLVPGRAPRDVATRVNEELTRDNTNSMFVTAFIARLNLATGELHYTNAGHNPPFVRRAGGAVDRYGTRHGPVLGAAEGATYGESVATLAPDDTLLLYTDGVTEAINLNGAFFTEQNLQQVLRERGAGCAREVAASVMDAVDRFADGAMQADDITLLSLRYGRRATPDAPVRHVLHVPNDLGEIPAALQQVQALVARCGGDRTTQARVALAFDELLSNVIKYGFPDPSPHQIECEIRHDKGGIIAVITDDGIPFDPLRQPDPDTTLSLEARGIGGLGIHLVRQLFDNVRYQRDAGRNVTTFTVKA